MRVEERTASGPAETRPSGAPSASAPLPYFSLVIPCYNEVEGLEHLKQTLEPVRTHLGETGYAWELLLVDDGSGDGTGDAILRVFEGWSELTLLRHGVNRGVGAAMRTGFNAARGAYVGCYDADCAYPALDLFKLLALVEAGADVASATPFLPGGTLEGVPLHRRALSQGLAGLYRQVLGAPAGGVQTFSCAFRVYRRDVIQTLRFDSDGFPAASEILARLVIRGAKVAEMPSTLRDRLTGVSKMKKGETIRAHLRLLARFARLRVEGRLHG